MEKKIKYIYYGPDGFYAEEFEGILGLLLLPASQEIIRTIMDAGYYVKNVLIFNHKKGSKVMYLSSKYHSHDNRMSILGVADIDRHVEGLDQFGDFTLSITDLIKNYFDLNKYNICPLGD